MQQKTKDFKHIERQLIPKLRGIGYLLLFFAALTLTYRLTLFTPPPSEELIEEETASLSLFKSDEESLLPENPGLYTLFATLFTALGLLSLSLAKRRHNRLSSPGDSS